MLKKIIIGFLCFIVVGAIALGIYVYMLDWNKHKSIVSERFSQITGLQTLIDGNLKVELFPTPRFTANKVKFSKNNRFQDPLVVVNEISANVALWPLLHNKFILNSMTLNGATVSVVRAENGEFNWHGLVTNNNNKSGNVEVSFNDVRLINSNFSYKDLKDKKEFILPNVSASINAPSLKGPYKTNGKFIYNNSEFKFNGSITKGTNVAVKMDFENASTSSKSSIDGTLGNNAKGNITLDISHLRDFVTVIFGENTLKEVYDKPLFISFSYSSENEVIKLDKFNISYGKNTKGNGFIAIKNDSDKMSFATEINMSQFDLGLLEQLILDTIQFSKKNKVDEILSPYRGVFRLKADQAVYRNAQAQNLILDFNLGNNVLTINPFAVEFPANTSIKTNGAIDFNNPVHYELSQNFTTDDLRTFASVFGIDLSKYANEANKKNIFKKSEGNITYSGNLDNLTIKLSKMNIDASSLQGNIGIVNKDGKRNILAAIQVAKILFDKYIEVLPETMSSASIEDKVLHQLNLIDWNHNLNVDASVIIGSAVYNDVPLQGINIDFTAGQDTLNVRKLIIDDLAGAKINLVFDANNVYKSPFFNELTYDIKTSNFPAFLAALNLDFGDSKLLQRKTYSAQGVLSGSFNDFDISSVQNFDDVELSYTGRISEAKSKPLFTGDLELKSNNFSLLTKDLGLNYKPNIPITSFTLLGKFQGHLDNFTITGLTSYLGADKITGNLKADYSTKLPNVSAQLNFEQFDADHLLDLSQFNVLKSTNDKQDAFINKPNFNDEKLDYAFLKSANFDIKATINSLIYKKDSYSDASFDSVLKDGILKVNQFKAKHEDSLADLTFTLDSNNLPSIQGSYDFKAVPLPLIGGTIYAIDGGTLDARGTFSSSAVSARNFFENLTSNGDFQLVKTAIKGWDLDIIKFELEQRKNVDGLHDSVFNSLKSGKSMFSKVSGKYDISKGVVVADNIIFDSPVVQVNMKLNLNLSDWLFNAVFQAVYHNASFADVLKFTFKDKLARPSFNVDLSESIQRIKSIEKLAQDQKKKEELSIQNKLSDKINNLKDRINSLQQEASRITLDVVRFEPVSNHKDVKKIYRNNLSLLNTYDTNLKKMLETLRNNPKEEDLRNIEAELSAQISKVEFIPKSLEDNFVVDCKYIFDDIFNKIAWVYSIAQNNSAYHTGMVENYEKSVRSLNSQGNSINDNTWKQLLLGTQEVNDEFEKISSLHDKIRDNYLNIMDTVQADEMENNNKIANQALETILLYVENMNNKIISNLKDYRAVLNIDSSGDDEYIIYPPKNSVDIDVSKTINPNVKNDSSIETSGNSLSGDVILPEKNLDSAIENKEDKKKVDLSSNAVISESEFGKTNVKLKNKNSDFLGGLSQLVKNKEIVLTEENSVKNTPENKIQKSAKNDELIVTSNNEKKNLESLVISSNKESESSKKIDVLLKKTKTAINDVLEKIKINKYNLSEEEPPLSDKVADLKDNQPDQVKDNQPDQVSANSSFTYKINPVVAMDLGKPLIEANTPQLSDYSSKKSRFKKVLYETEQSFLPEASKNSAPTRPISITDQNNFLLEMIKAEHTIGQAIVAQDISIRNKMMEIKEDNNKVMKDDSENSKDINSPLRITQNDTVLANTIGKSMLLKSINPPLFLPSKEHQYLFKSDGVNFIPFGGSVGKTISLYTK